jgi:hypothetical protein
MSLEIKARALRVLLSLGASCTSKPISPPTSLPSTSPSPYSAPFLQAVCRWRERLHEDQCLCILNSPARKGQRIPKDQTGQSLGHWDAGKMLLIGFPFL